jgi:hypothetical protein
LAKFDGASTRGLTWLIAIYSSAYFFSSIFVLYRNGLPHRLYLTVGVAGSVVLTFIALAERAT